MLGTHNYIRTTGQAELLLKETLIHTHTHSYINTTGQAELLLKETLMDTNTHSYIRTTGQAELLLKKTLMDEQQCQVVKLEALTNRALHQLLSSHFGADVGSVFAYVADLTSTCPSRRLTATHSPT